MAVVVRVAPSAGADFGVAEHGEDLGNAVDVFGGDVARDGVHEGLGCVTGIGDRRVAASNEHPQGLRRCRVGLVGVGFGGAVGAAEWR